MTEREQFQELAKAYKLTPGPETANALRWFLLGKQAARAAAPASMTPKEMIERFKRGEKREIDYDRLAAAPAQEHPRESSTGTADAPALVPNSKEKPPACPDCKGTGMRDSGGVHPWGQAIFVPCDCAAAPAEPVAWMHRQGNHTEVSDRQLDDFEIARAWTQTPLYASPPRSAEWVAEAMRLADVAANC